MPERPKGWKTQCLGALFLQTGWFFFGVFLFQVVRLFGFACFGFEVGSWEFDRFSLTTLSIG